MDGLTADNGVSRTAQVEARAWSEKVLRVSSLALAATVWASSSLFGLYILAFYAGALTGGAMDRWNETLPGLYSAKTPAATVGIGLHFAAGGIILILGFVQLIKAIRTRFPAIHRWVGRIYVAASLAAGGGGLTSILFKGTIGGALMSFGFAIYGLLMILAAVQTFRTARAGQMEKHRAWALRLFALGVGSWLYRMDYGFWLMLTGGAGHTEEFNGWFDAVMMFFFYVPNLLVVEAFIRGRKRATSPPLRLAAASILLGATGFLLLGTYYFTKLFWGPAILERIAG